MAESLATRVASIPYWYHRIELPGEIVTPGWAPLDASAYRLPADLTGKRVLDVGAWDGYWTFAALDRGAVEVVAIDDHSDRLGFLDPSVPRGWDGFDVCREALGWSESRCRRVSMSIYEVSEEALGRFDVVLMFGTVYHLRYPLLGLDRLAAVCTEALLVESAILDDFSPYRGGLGHGYPGGQMVMEFYPSAEYGRNPGNWWVPTLQCLANMVAAAGFDRVEAWSLSRQPPNDVAGCRGIVHGRRQSGTTG